MYNLYQISNFNFAHTYVCECFLICFAAHPVIGICDIHYRKEIEGLFLFLFGHTIFFLLRDISEKKGINTRSEGL